MGRFCNMFGIARFLCRTSWSGLSLFSPVFCRSSRCFFGHDEKPVRHMMIFFVMMAGRLGAKLILEHAVHAMYLDGRLFPLTHSPLSPVVDESQFF